ncbi:MAG: winged-helix domain-containing protein, partial [Pseudomonadota bacterium]
MPKTGRTALVDPFYEREAEKYESPITSREMIFQYLFNKKKPQQLDRILKDLELPAEAEEGLQRRLKAMVRDGQLRRARSGFSCIPGAMSVDGDAQSAADEGTSIPDLIPPELRALEERPAKKQSATKVSPKAPAAVVVDPHYEREAEKYESPIVSRETLLEFLTQVKRPISEKLIAQSFGIQDEEGQEAVRRRLNAMVRDGQLACTKKGFFPNTESSSREALISFDREGKPTARIFEDSSWARIFMPYGAEPVFPGDRVQLQVFREDERGQKIARIIEITHRAKPMVVGRYELIDGVGFVYPQTGAIASAIFNDIKVNSIIAEAAPKTGDYVAVALSRDNFNPHRPT